MLHEHKQATLKFIRRGWPVSSDKQLFTTLRINWCCGANMTIDEYAIFISALPLQQK